MSLFMEYKIVLVAIIVRCLFIISHVSDIELIKLSVIFYDALCTRMWYF